MAIILFVLLVLEKGGMELIVVVKFSRRQYSVSPLGQNCLKRLSARRGFL